MDFGLISDILIYITMVMVLIGLILLVYVTLKFEQKASEKPEEASSFRERRRTILKMYLRVLILIFVLAVITAVLDSQNAFG
jgi:heme/copper-type cytochrome/quinol oxidase subunit 2